jgi:basic membrane lipoprotein Med (substrate-binding protein (PBP1-ABC) superfamily)
VNKKMGRGIRLAAVIAVLAIVGAACSKSTNNEGPSPSNTGTSSSPAAKAFKVAVVLPSAKNDASFSQSMVDALNSLQASENLDIKITENAFVVADAANDLRTYASQGYNLVIAHGSQYGSIIQQLAPQFPNVSFAWGTAADTFGMKNVWGYQSATDQGGYVQGVMAAMMTKSKKLGVVCPIAVGDGKLYSDGFVNGVHSVDPSMTVKVTCTGSFSDVGLAASVAKAFISQGMDILTGSSQATVGAINVCKTDNIPWFGMDVNQTSLAPTVVVSSTVYHWEVVLKQIIDSIKKGSLGGAAYTIGLANKGETIEFNPAYNIPADVKAKADQTITAIEGDATITGVTG